MSYKVSVEAVQLKRDDETFFGTEVRGFYYKERRDGEKLKIFHSDIKGDQVFTNIPIGGASVKVCEGDWVVTYPDGYIEVLKDVDFKKMFVADEKKK